MVFERKLLRKIFGPTKERDGTWRIKTNDELDKLMRHKNIIGAPDSAVCQGTALQTGRSRDRFPMVSLEFFINIILPVALWPWVRLSL